MGRGPSSALAPGEKPKNFSKAIKDTIRYMGRYKWAILACMLIAVISTIFQTVGPKVMGRATTELASGLMAKIRGSGGIDFGLIAKILIFTLVLYGIGAIAQFVQGLVMTNITQRAMYRLREDISTKIGHLPMSYFEKVQIGEVLSRITNDVDTLGMGMSQSISNIITSTAMVIGVIVMMFSISALMALIALLVVPVSAAFMAFIVKISQKHFIKQQEYLGIIDSQVEENFSGHQVIKAFNGEALATDEFNQANNILYESAWKSQFISGLMHPVMSVVGNLGFTGVAISGGFLCSRGKIGVGDIQAFIQYVRNLSQPIQEVARIMNQVQSMAAAAERVFQFLSEPEETESSDIKPLEGEFSGAVEFRHVRFGYNPDTPVINDFSARIEPGAKVAIVGPTGAGKTTIVKLLMRFYDVDSGEILIDGTNINEFSRKDLRSNFAMVLQDTWLFEGSIAENISYGKEGATMDEIIEAAKAARVHRFIKTLPSGYDMVLGEDASNISEGQRQLLTIARAILADKSILILDEATSSVDTRTEELIQKAMDALTLDRTSFIIAHRLSTIRDADLILVMDHGDIVELGTHDSLLARDGFYAKIYNSQFESLE